MGSALRLSWHVDSADRIVAIEGPWEEVAAAYQAVELTKARVIGTSWREHVADAEIKLLWDAASPNPSLSPDEWTGNRRSVAHGG